MIHVYALTGEPVDLGDVAGIDGRRVRTVACPPLHACVSDHDRAPGATRERALAHARVVAAAGDRADAVPVQFGAQHADEASLCATVAERAVPLAGALRRVGGHVEVAVRCGRPPTGGGQLRPARDGARRTGDEGSSGRAYLEGRLEQERAERAAHLAAVRWLGECTGPLERLAVETTDRVGPSGPERCLLVHRDDVGALLAAAHDAADEHDDLVVVGPWPPYTFAADA